MNIFLILTKSTLNKSKKGTRKFYLMKITKRKGNGNDELISKDTFLPAKLIRIK